MDDKFILLGLEDAGDVAEALKNQTCKKLLNYLGDVKEASEKDISDALKIPINTVEYSLKKLIKIGLVEKTKSFFWSVKGKKIPMYKLAKRHIIISPNKKFDLGYLKNMLPVVFVMGIFSVFVKFLLEKNIMDKGAELITKAPEASMSAAESFKTIQTINNISFLDKILDISYFGWFLAGAIIVFIFILIVNKMKGGKYGKIN
ncbi:MAG: helix-turn-helix domain-containing protein [Nanoarchaeota archaeon]